MCSNFYKDDEVDVAIPEFVQICFERICCVLFGYAAFIIKMMKKCLLSPGSWQYALK